MLMICWLDPLVVSLCRSSPVAREEQRRNHVTHACGLFEQAVFGNFNVESTELFFQTQCRGLAKSFSDIFFDSNHYFF